jgi:hypothetical protein
MRIAAVAFVAAAMTATANTDVILSAAALNDALKKMERLTQTISASSGAAKANAWFDLGTQADALATLINDEVAAHGSQEKALIDLGISRTREIGVAIAYDSSKKKFFYDNAAFREYLAIQPKGDRAAQASFKLIEGDFFQSSATDIKAILAATERKRAFLKQFRTFEGAVEVHLMLSVDYRDLYRYYKGVGDVPNRDRYRDLTRQQLRMLMKSYPTTEQAEIARRMLERFDEEVRGAAEGYSQGDHGDQGGRADQSAEPRPSAASDVGGRCEDKEHPTDASGLTAVCPRACNIAAPVGDRRDSPYC